MQGYLDIYAEFKSKEGCKLRVAELEAIGAGRAQAIRTWLLESGKVPAERIFLAPVAGSGARVNLNLK